MEDARGSGGITVKSVKIFVFEGNVLDLPEDFEESSEPLVSTDSEKSVIPRYSDGNSFPANFLEHGTVTAYPSDK